MDVIVNAAGSMPFRPLAETEPDGWRKAFDVDLIGSFMLTREMLRRISPGAIVNVAAHDARPHRVALSHAGHLRGTVEW